MLLTGPGKTRHQPKPLVPQGLVRPTSESPHPFLWRPLAMRRGSLFGADGPLADRRGYPRLVNIAHAMILCPTCGSDRLIPLTFPPPWRHGRYFGQPEAKPIPGRQMRQMWRAHLRQHQGSPGAVPRLTLCSAGTGRESLALRPVPARPAAPTATVYADCEGRVSHSHPSWRSGRTFPRLPARRCPTPISTRRFKLNDVVHRIRAAVGVSLQRPPERVVWSGAAWRRVVQSSSA